jgi:hypothetical protein
MTWHHAQAQHNSYPVQYWLFISSSLWKISVFAPASVSHTFSASTGLSFFHRSTCLLLSPQTACQRSRRSRPPACPAPSRPAPACRSSTAAPAARAVGSVDSQKQHTHCKNTVIRSAKTMQSTATPTPIRRTNQSNGRCTDQPVQSAQHVTASERREPRQHNFTPLTAAHARHPSTHRQEHSAHSISCGTRHAQTE